MDHDEDVAVASTASNLSSSWWEQASLEYNSALPFDSSEGGLWSGHFVPPPPRPIFVDDNIATDGLTTCDLCTWAWKNTNSFALDATLEAPGEIGWVLTMVIVSLISAVIGAVVMIIVIRCRRMKNIAMRGIEGDANPPPRHIRPAMSLPLDKLPQAPYETNHQGVWSWLSRRTTPIPPQLGLPSVENHYTHMEEPYGGSGGGEALYAELDRESSLDRTTYQNSAYTDPDAQPSSPPSSAYYSDLSVNAAAPADRAYEIVGLQTLPMWDDGANANRRAGTSRLAAISEGTSVPSDYV